MEDEVDGQEEGQGDKREDGQQREESGAVEENQNEHMSAWRGLMTRDVRTTNTRLEPRMCVWISEKMRRVRCGVHTPQTTVSCKRSNCNKPKNSWKSTRLRLCEETAQRVSPFYLLLCTWAQLRTFLLIVMSSTRNRSTATKMCWMKKTTDAISGIASKESVRVALLQTHGEDGAILLRLRWSLNGVSSVLCVQNCWERSTNSFCI